MTENVYVNYLVALEKPFRDFTVITRPALIISPVKDNMKNMYALIRQLSITGVADVDFRRNTIFVKGDDEEVAKRLKENKIVFVGEERDTARLEINRDLNTMRAIFYQALLRYISKKGFRMFWGRKGSKWKKLLPLDFDIGELMKRKLAIEIGDDLVLYRGLYVMLETFDNGDAILWVDLYSPIVKQSEVRPLSPKEAKQLGLKDKYTAYIPTPIERLELTKKLLGMLCEDSKLNVTFADGFAISFVCDFPLLGVSE